MKRVLALYYSQTDQLGTALRSFLAGLGEEDGEQTLPLDSPTVQVEPSHSDLGGDGDGDGEEREVLDERDQTAIKTVA